MPYQSPTSNQHQTDTRYRVAYQSCDWYVIFFIFYLSIPFVFSISFFFPLNDYGCFMCNLDIVLMSCWLWNGIEVQLNYLQENIHKILQRVIIISTSWIQICLGTLLHMKIICSNSIISLTISRGLSPIYKGILMNSIRYFWYPYQIQIYPRLFFWRVLIKFRLPMF